MAYLGLRVRRSCHAASPRWVVLVGRIYSPVCAMAWRPRAWIHALYWLAAKAQKVRARSEGIASAAGVL